MLKLKFDKFPELKTERLYLRQIQKKDVKIFHKMRTDTAVMEFMDIEKPNSIQDTQKKIENDLELFSRGESVYWAIALKHNNEMIGGAGYWRIIKEHYRAEIGYQLLSEFWRRGYAFEALNSIIQFGFKIMGLHSIEANVNPKNDPSIKLLEKLGFKQEAYFKENYYFNGNFLDSAIFSLLITNWRS
jgi:ribosomal-protein-alanine N-acetyltransferase